MPRAEPTQSLAPLHLSAVVEAATLRGRESPHPLRVSWGPPSGYPWESPGADLALRHGHCHDTCTALARRASAGAPHTANGVNDPPAEEPDEVKRFVHAWPEGEDWRGGMRLSPRP